MIKNSIRLNSKHSKTWSKFSYVCIPTVMNSPAWKDLKGRACVSNNLKASHVDSWFKEIHFNPCYAYKYWEAQIPIYYGKKILVVKDIPKCLHYTLVQYVRYMYKYVYVYVMYLPICSSVTITRNILFQFWWVYDFMSFWLFKGKRLLRKTKF